MVRKTANSGCAAPFFVPPICACGPQESLALLGSFRGIFWDSSNACRLNRLRLMPRRGCCAVRGPHQPPVHLSPQAYELLCALVDARPRAIAKSELHEHLWPSTFVSEAMLASLVAEVWEALGERGRETPFIRTVYGFGYAFSGLARENGSPDPGPYDFVERRRACRCRIQ
jgi:hypothetical protein